MWDDPPVAALPNRARTGPSSARSPGAEDLGSAAQDAGTIGAFLDPEAIEQLVRDHQDALRGFLRYLGCPSRSVDDIAQETFLTFLSARFEPRSDRSTARFLRSIARHLFLKSLRGLQRAPASLDVEAAEAAWVRYHDDERGPYLEALGSCLTGLRGKARTALQLRYASDLGQVAIADRMNLTESGVHSLLVRARKRLRTCVEEKLGRGSAGLTGAGGES